MGRSITLLSVRQRLGPIRRPLGRLGLRSVGGSLGLAGTLANEGKSVIAYQVVPLDAVLVPVVQDGEALLPWPVEPLAQVVGLRLVDSAFGRPVRALNLAAGRRPKPMWVVDALLRPRAESPAGPKSVQVIFGNVFGEKVVLFGTVDGD